MLTQAFYSGITGLQSNSTGIDVVTNNLANINTVGYRSYDVEFSSLFEESLVSMGSSNVANSSVGIGTRVSSTAMRESTGSILLSDRNTDLAIDGDGWFSVKGEGNPLYTRDGNFTFDTNNDLVSTDGLYVLGTMGNNISQNNTLTNKLDTLGLSEVDQQEKLRFPKYLTYPPEATKNVQFFGNLGLTKDTRTMGTSVVDKQNNRNQLILEFNQKDIQTPPGVQWDVVATIKSVDGETTFNTKSGVVEFDATGALVSNSLQTIDNQGTTVNIDLGSGYSGVIATNTTSVTGSSTADGTIGGDLLGYEINRNAEVIASFTNGEQSVVGKVALFHFQNDQGLDRLNGSRFQESSNSGKAIFYKNEKGENINSSSILNFSLEGSNYDMASGLTELIILQRAYDASSKLVTTADQMMQKALSMDA